MTATPVRNDGGTTPCPTTPCPICGEPFVPVGRQRVCSAACRKALWRRRHAPPVGGIPARVAPASTIYECPSCETRYLGEQRCPDCALFCRKLGPGAPCPHCDEPILLADLLLGMEGGDARFR
jgi:hypothetical protein